MFPRSREKRIPFLLASRPYDEISLRFLPQKGGILLETQRSSRPQVFLSENFTCSSFYKTCHTLAWIITEKDSATDIFPVQLGKFLWRLFFNTSGRLHLNSRH